MNQNQLTDVTYKLEPQNYENIFSVSADTDGYYYYNLLRTINFPVDLKTDSYVNYVVLTNDTWPLIAWKKYYDIKLWWIICAGNQIENPVNHPVPGTILKIIDPLVVKSLLNEIGQI